MNIEVAYLVASNVTKTRDHVSVKKAVFSSRKNCWCVFPQLIKYVFSYSIHQTIARKPLTHQHSATSMNIEVAYLVALNVGKTRDHVSVKKAVFSSHKNCWCVFPELIKYGFVNVCE